MKAFRLLGTCLWAFLIGIELRDWQKDGEGYHWMLIGMYALIVSFDLLRAQLITEDK
jgi:hypothetical protein